MQSLHDNTGAHHAGQADVKAVVDQEIGQEIARLEAKIDAVISEYFGWLFGLPICPSVLL